MGMSSAAESLLSVPALHLVSDVLPEQMSASERGPRDPAALGELIAGEVSFPQDLLDRHIYHPPLIISVFR